MQYSFTIKGEGFVRAQKYDINASYKDLGAVCDAIRYVKAEEAIGILDRVIEMERAIPYRRHNKHMGSRSELGGSKGGYPEKAAQEVKDTLVNAIANAGNQGLDGQTMYVIHASANKTRIEKRYPSKGSLAWGRGMYGRSAINHSDLELAKIEIVLSDSDSRSLTHNMKYFIKSNDKVMAHMKKQTKKPSVKPTPPKKAKTSAAEKAPPTAAIAAPKTDQVAKEIASKVNEVLKAAKPATHEHKEHEHKEQEHKNEQKKEEEQPVKTEEKK